MRVWAAGRHSVSREAAEHDPARLHDKGRGDNTELDAIAMIPGIKWGREVARTMAGLQSFDDPNR